MESNADTRHIAAVRARYRENYLARWRAMIAAWQRPEEPCMAWLMYSANYLFSTGGVRWALDPLRPDRMLPDLPVGVPARALKSLSFVLLTHRHSDHYDPLLLGMLRDGPTRFVVPGHMADDFRQRVDPPPRQVIVASPGRGLTIEGVRIEPFRGWHRERGPDGRISGLEATGYLVTAGGRRLLFPGDVRAYRPGALRSFAPVDRLFAHLWLGRGAAGAADPPLRRAFVDFLLAAGPAAVVLAHLYELSREPEQLWHRGHARQVIAELAGRVPVHVPEIGAGLVL